ncbi:hypothetical protein, partial [Campylobacter sp. 1]|uniref:hypothetical protein n=1 Tax=Campylobacter sp. 1 TaxID=2039344 RepID=UPI000BD3984A
IYEKERYFTFTGNVVTDKPILDKQSLIDAVVKRHFGFKEEEQEFKLSPDIKPIQATNAELWTRMFNSKNGAAIQALYNGERGEDHSGADVSLCNHLA